MLKKIGKGFALFVLQMVIFAVFLWIGDFLDIFWIAVPLLNLFFAIFIVQIYDGLDVPVLLSSFIFSLLVYGSITVWLCVGVSEFTLVVPFLFVYDFFMSDIFYIAVYIVHRVNVRKKEKLLNQEAEKNTKEKQ